MKCASVDCTCAELSVTAPCVVCGRGVHHICSNELYDSGTLAERFCSASCLYKRKTMTSPPSTSEMEAQDSASQLSAIPASQESALSTAESVELSLPPNDVVDLTMASSTETQSSASSSSTSPGVDAFGIPLEVYHYRQQNSCHGVWDVAHRLTTPYTSMGQDMEAYTHVCLLCAQQLTCSPFASSIAWESALHRWSNTSNARAHMIALHEDHQVGKTDKDMKLKAATQHVVDAMARAHAQENKRANPVTTNERANKRCSELGRLWTTTQREIGIFVAQWLVSAGLPYNTVTTEDFKLLIQRLTGDPSATMLAASTFRDLLAALFAKFCEATKALLLHEHKAAHGLPFLNLHHDGWTTGNGNVAALGTSVSFIDRSWQHREIALLLTVGHSSHAAFDVKKMICTRTLDVYGIDINEMVQFSVSDTASAARKVSKLFEESTQTDCSMHVLNLCLQYAMGLRENKETIEVYDPVTDTRKREQRYCTVGGAFEEGRDLIKNVRALNNYFSTQLRCKRLEGVQEFFKLPELKTMVDSDTRVGFTLKLFQRTIVNYKAFSVYFQKCEKGDDASVFDRLTLVEWRLLVEMEAICRPIGDLARFEVQRSELVASE